MIPVVVFRGAVAAFEVFGDGGLGNTDDTLVDTVCRCDFSTVDAL